MKAVIGRWAGSIAIAILCIGSTESWSRRATQAPPSSIIFDIHPPIDGPPKQYKSGDVIFAGNIRKSDAIEISQQIKVNWGNYQIDFDKVGELNITNFYENRLVIKLMTDIPPFQRRIVNREDAAFCTNSVQSIKRIDSNKNMTKGLLCLIDESSDGKLEKLLLLNSRNEQEILESIETPIDYETKRGIEIGERFELRLSIDDENYIRFWPRIIVKGKEDYPKYVSMHNEDGDCRLYDEKISWTGARIDSEFEKRKIFGFVLEFSNLKMQSKVINVSSKSISESNYMFITRKSWIPNIEENCSPARYDGPL